MKKLLLLTALLCFAGKAMCHVSRQDVKNAKWKYLHDSTILSYEKEYNYPVRDSRYGCFTFYADSTETSFIIEMQESVVEMERITWEGLKEIRHDQHIPKFLRRY